MSSKSSRHLWSEKAVAVAVAVARRVARPMPQTAARATQFVEAAEARAKDVAKAPRNCPSRSRMLLSQQKLARVPGNLCRMMMWLCPVRAMRSRREVSSEAWHRASTVLSLLRTMVSPRQPKLRRSLREIDLQMMRTRLVPGQGFRRRLLVHPTVVLARRAMVRRTMRLAKPKALVAQSVG